MDRDQVRRTGRFIELAVERFLFASRWILAPFYLGLAFAIVILLIKFIEEFLHVAVTAFVARETDIILGVLSLVDLTLTGSLLVIVIFSGYENFVSKIDHSHHRDWPEWMGTIDFTALKLKLLSSIVAISAIQLLKQFMGVANASDRDLMWYVIIHLVFVGSSVLLALSDRISANNHSVPHASPAAAGDGASGRQHGSGA
ncbi:MAG TPA: TIGR00645 family protein [Hyphomicrobiaceae bacterium]|nr:TIGR00645 family protein [Hyphomicrobiaceae bacterium]